MNAIVCTKCGSNDLVERGGSYICKHCGTRFAKQQTQAQRPVNVNFVYNNNTSSARATSDEAKLLDREIRICEEYNRLTAQANKKPSVNLFSTACCFIVPFVICYVLASFIWGYETSLLRTIFTYGIPLIYTIWAIMKSSALDAQEAKEKTANASELERVTRLYNQITLIPEEYRHQDEALRNFYDNYGAKTQKELMDRMVEYNKKVTIIKNYY